MGAAQRRYAVAQQVVRGALKTELRRLDRTSDKQTLREKAHAFLQYLQHAPERVKGYFKHKTLEYVAQSGVLLPG